MILSFTSNVKTLWDIPISIIWASYEAFLHGRCHGNLQNRHWELGFRDLFDEIAFMLYISLTGRKSIQLGFFAIALFLICAMFPIFTVEEAIAETTNVQVVIAFVIILSLSSIIFIFIPAVRFVKFQSTIATCLMVVSVLLVTTFYSTCANDESYFTSISHCNDLSKGKLPIIPSFLALSVPWLLSFSLRCRWWHATLGGTCAIIIYCANFLRFTEIDVTIPVVIILIFSVATCSVTAFSVERDIRAGFKREGAVRRKLQSVLNEKTPGLLHSNTKQKVLTSLAFLESVLTEVDESMIIKWASVSVTKTIGGHSNSVSKRNFLENVHKDDIEMIRTEFTNLLQYAKLQSLEAVYRGRQHLHVPIIRVQYRRRNQIPGLDDEASVNNPGSWSWREAEIRPLIWKPQKVPGAPKFISYGLGPDGESIIGPLEAGKLGETSALILERSIFEDRRRVVEMGFGHLLPTSGRIIASTTVDANIFVVGASAGIPYPPTHFSIDTAKEHNKPISPPTASHKNENAEESPSCTPSSIVKFDAHFERSMYTLLTSMLLSLSSMEMLLPAGLLGIRTITNYLIHNSETNDPNKQKDVQTPHQKQNFISTLNTSLGKSLTHLDLSPSGASMMSPVHTDMDAQSDIADRNAPNTFSDLENALLSTVEILSLVSESLPHMRGSILDTLIVSRSRCPYIPVREGVPIQWRNLVAKSVFFSTKRINTLIQTAAIIAMRKGKKREEKLRNNEILKKHSHSSVYSGNASKTTPNTNFVNDPAWDDIFSSTSGILPFSVSISLSFRSNFPPYLLADVLHAPRLLDIALAAVTSAVSKRYTNILRPNKRADGSQSSTDEERHLEKDISVWYSRDIVRVAPVLITVTAGKNAVETNSTDPKGNRIVSRDSVRIEFAFDSSGVGGIRGISEALSLDPLTANGPHAIPQPGTFFTPSYPPKVLETILKRDVDNVQALLTNPAPSTQAKYEGVSFGLSKHTSTVNTGSSQKFDLSEPRTKSASNINIGRMTALLDLLLPENHEKPLSDNNNLLDPNIKDPLSTYRHNGNNIGSGKKDSYDIDEVEDPIHTDIQSTNKHDPTALNPEGKNFVNASDKTRRAGAETTKKAPLLPTYSSPSLISLLQGTLSNGSAVSASPYSTVFAPTARELANVLDVRLLLPLLRHEILCLGGGVATCSASPDMVAAIQAASGSSKSHDREKSKQTMESQDSESTLPSGTDICVLILDIPCPAMSRQVVPGKSVPSAQEVAEELNRSHVGGLPDAHEVMKELKLDKLYDGGNLGLLHHPLHSHESLDSESHHETKHANRIPRLAGETSTSIPLAVRSNLTTHTDPRANQTPVANSGVHKTTSGARNSNPQNIKKGEKPVSDALTTEQRRIQGERKSIVHDPSIQLPSAAKSSVNSVQTFSRPDGGRNARPMESNNPRAPMDTHLPMSPDNKHALNSTLHSGGKGRDNATSSQMFTPNRGNIHASTTHTRNADTSLEPRRGLQNPPTESRPSESHLNLPNLQSKYNQSPTTSISSFPEATHAGVPTANQQKVVMGPSARSSMPGMTPAVPHDDTRRLEKGDGVRDATEQTTGSQGRRRSEGKKRVISEETKDLRVLFVDDDNVNRRQGFKMLSRLGCNPIMASDGDEVLSILQHASMKNKPIDCVLMDIVMQRQNGDVACSLVRSMGYDVPIVAMTGAFAARDVESFLKNGFTLVLPKPFDLTQMERAIISSKKIVLSKRIGHT